MLRKKSIGIMVITILTLVLGAANVAAASPAAETRLITYYTCTVTVETSGMGNIWFNEVPDLVDPATGSIQLRALANLAPWLTLDWDPDTATAIIENCITGHGIIIDPLAITAYQKMDVGIALAKIEGTISNIDGRIYLRTDPSAFQVLGIWISSSQRYRPDGWLTTFSIFISNPAIPPVPSTAGRG
jgi:hypothetical protein